MGLPSLNNMGLIINGFRVCFVLQVFINFGSACGGISCAYALTFWFFLCILEFLKSEEGGQKQNNKKKL